MGNKRDVYGDLVGTSEGKRPRGILKRSRRTLLKRIFKKRDGEAWTGLMWLRIRTVGGRLCMW
jgi:hypothetical protein